MSSTTLVALLALIPLIWAQEIPHSLFIENNGDLMLGGLFPIREMGMEMHCSDMINEKGIHRLEAMLFAIDKINEDAAFLPGIKLGYRIHDSCSCGFHAMNESLSFIDMSLSKMNMMKMRCADRTMPTKLMTNPLMGVVGAHKSWVTKMVTSMLHLHDIPMISPAATASKLSDKMKFDMFARTVPSDIHQAKVLADIARSLEWSLVSTVFSQGMRGQMGMDLTHKELKERSICIGMSMMIPYHADDNIYLNVINNLLKNTESRGVLLFTDPIHTKGLLKALKSLRLPLDRKLFFVSSDGLGVQNMMLKDLEDFVDGFITIDMKMHKIEAFDTYLKNLKPNTNTRNPFFRLYWEQLFECNVQMEGLSGPRQKQNCAPNLNLEQKGYLQDPKISYTMDAVFAFAHALKALHREKCSGQPGVCPAMLMNFDGHKFFKDNLMNIQFRGLGGNEVKFDTHGDGAPKYNIYNILKKDGKLEFKLVGNWNRALTLNKQDLKFGAGVSEIPMSRSSGQCTLDEFLMMMLPLMEN